MSRRAGMAILVAGFAGTLWMLSSLADASHETRRTEAVAIEPARPAQIQPLVPIESAVGDPSVVSRTEIPVEKPASVADEKPPGYEEALARFLYPPATGNADVDRRNVLRHIILHQKSLDPDRADMRLDVSAFLKMPGVVPAGLSLSPEDRERIGAILAEEQPSTTRLWRERVRVEQQCLLRAVDAGSFEWVAEDSTAQPPVQSTAKDFAERMRSTYGELCKDWYFISVGGAGWRFTPYFSKFSQPEFFDAQARFMTQLDRVRDRVKDHVHALPQAQRR